jgi:hypothetical protein
MASNVLATSKLSGNINMRGSLHLAILKLVMGSSNGDIQALLDEIQSIVKRL